MSLHSPSSHVLLCWLKRSWYMYYKLAINYCTLYSWKYLKLGSFVANYYTMGHYHYLGGFVQHKPTAMH